MRKWKIGLLGLDDPASLSTYSGTLYHLGYFLRKAGHEVRPLGPYPIKRGWLASLYNRVLQTFTNRHIIWARHSLIASQYGRIVDSYAENNPDLDFLLAPAGFYLGNARTRKPLVSWADTTVAGVIGRYPYYTGLSKRMIEQCHAFEQQSLNACSLAVFSSQWAKDVALDNYSVDPRKVHFVPYGANLTDAPQESEISEIVTARSRGAVRALLVGMDWHRKGVDKAIEVVRELRGRGYEATLTVVGATPPKGRNVPDFVNVAGRIAKDSVEGRARLASLYQTAHLLLLPTIAECASVALAEASAFGVPVLSTDVGGNGSLVRNGVNGFLLPLDAAASVWADHALPMLGERHNTFAFSSYRFFRENLMWESSVARLERLVSTHISGLPDIQPVMQDHEKSEQALAAKHQ
jgi:glycosyltransferase involved in cell wall biosynthesis